MTHSRTRIFLCCIALASASGCKQAEQTQVQSHDQVPSNAATAAAALRESTTSDKLAADNAKRARAVELESLIATGKAQREVLAQQKSTIERQLATFQEDSSATLNRLKAEMQTLQRQKAKATGKHSEQGNNQTLDAFNERARNQMEHALAMDQEYQTQLQQVSDDLGQLDTRLAAMQTELNQHQSRN